MSDRRRMGGSARFLREKVRARDAGGTFRRLLGLFRTRKGPLVGVLVLVTLGAGLGLAVPWLVGRVIDGIGGQIPVSPLVLLGVLAGVYLLDALGSRAQARLAARLSQGLVYDLRRRLFDALVRLPLAVFDRRDRGDLMSRMTNDIDAVATGIAQTGTQLAAAVLGVAGSLLLMVLLSPLLTAAALVTVPLVFGLTTLVARRTKGWFRAQQTALGALNAHLEETVNGFLEVKVFDREAAVVDRFEALNEELRRTGTQAQLWAGLVMPLMNVINNFGLAVLAAVGGLMTLDRLITVGLIASFVGYSRQFGRPLNDIANGWNTLQAALAGAERVFEVLDEAPEAPDAPGARPLEAPRGEVRFEGVGFAYLPDRPVLRSLDLVVPPGSTVALVGPTGSGKTTVVNLLLRFYEPASGRILLDGRPLDAWTRPSLLAAFGVVLQDTWLFEGTVADNIRYGRPGAPAAEVEAAARTANADGFIRLLPRGYDTVLKSGGSELSQGQRQLLAIARAVLADAPLLILDEATSNIDTRTELHVQEALLKLMEGRTSFLVAHRLSTIRQADRIVLLDGGEILETGTHDELVALGGRYAELYRSTLGTPRLGKPGA